MHPNFGLDDAYSTFICEGGWKIGNVRDAIPDINKLILMLWLLTLRVMICVTLM